MILISISYEGREAKMAGRGRNARRVFVVSNEIKIKVSDTVTLLGVQIDYRLKFDSHFQKICTKASLQLDCLKRLARYMG